MNPHEAHAKAGKGDTVIGWALDPEQRTELLQQFPPRFPNVVAGHVTLNGGARAEAELPGAVSAEIVGRVDDGSGVEAMVVAIDGGADRPDGSSYHITWSLDRGAGRKAVESNQVIRERGWASLDLPMPLLLTPARWP